jgi:hypothetical protein
MLGVSIGDDHKKVEAFRKQFRVSFPIVPDQTGEVFTALKLPGVPYMIMTDRDGKVLMSHNGALKDLDKMLKEIREIHGKQ